MDDTNSYFVDEFGRPLPRFRPLAPNERGRHGSFGSAVDAAIKDLVVERNDFFDSLADRWAALFPKSPARPGRYEDGRIFLYVRSAPALFAFRPRLPAVKRALAALPDAPGKFDVVLEIRK